MKLVVAPAEVDERLDRLLARRLPELSRARLQKLIADGDVRVGGRPARASQRPAPGDEVEVSIPEPAKVALVPEEMALPVLWEDEHLLVIDKPARIAVHPGAGLSRGTIVHGLLHQVRNLAGIGGELRPGIVHRLDKDTSGCLAVAKSDAALRGLQALFKSRQVEKRYLALVHGSPPDRGELDTFFGRHPVDRKRMSSRVSTGRRAVTRWTVLHRAAGAAFLEIELLTGRTHQIRAHLADQGWPLVGDALYGGRRKESRLAAGAPLRLAADELGRQALHAFRLAFDHPLAPGRVRCEAPLPADLRGALARLGIPAA